MSTTDKTAPLLDQHGNHHKLHGGYLHAVERVTALAVTRGAACMHVSTGRNCRHGELATVVVNANAPAFSAYVRLTPEDAEAMAASLQQAAATARAVNAQVEAGACK